MKYVEFMKKFVPLHDDLFDFFYEALPGYEEVGKRRILLGCWGSYNDPDYCDYDHKNMAEWGRRMFVTPGVVVDGELVTNSLVDINLNIRILLGNSYYDDWQGSETLCRTLCSSRETAPTSSRVSTSCAPSETLTHACPVAFTCISATARSSKPVTLPCSA
jgi:hypothetical protein